MSAALTHEVKEMLFGIEITLVSGFVFFYGFLTDLGVLWGVGLVGVLFGLWLTVDAYTGPETAADVERGDVAEDVD